MKGTPSEKTPDDAYLHGTCKRYAGSVSSCFMNTRKSGMAWLKLCAEICANSAGKSCVSIDLFRFFLRNY